MTLVAILPLPFMAYGTSRLGGEKTHKAFGESQAAFSELNNKVQESVSVKRLKNDVTWFVP